MVFECTNSHMVHFSLAVDSGFHLAVCNRARPWWHKAGNPNPQAMDQYWSVAYWEPGCTTEGKPASKTKTIPTVHSVEKLYSKKLTPSTVQPIGKTIASTIWTFVGKMISLLFNMLSCLSQLFFQGANVF